MSPKKILIIGDGSSAFVLNHVKNVKDAANYYSFDILLTNSYLKQDYRPYFDNVFSTFRKNLLTEIPFVNGFFIRISIILSLLLFKKKYDYVHIQFLNDNIIYTNRFHKIGKRVIISIWGSDFYRSRGINLYFKKRILKIADIISFSNDKTMEDFSKVIPTRAVMKICRFGLIPLEYLQDLNSTKNESRNILNIPLGKTIVTLGYNLNPNQQHIKILEEIKKLKDTNYYPDIFLVVPLTYPTDKNNYKSELINALNSTGLQYKTIEHFLPEIENAHLRNCSDIMIQLQTTDQLSGTMQEYLYTDNLVITGSWLPYKTLINKGINMISINSISELSSVLDKTIINLPSLQRSVLKNKSIILKLSSWHKNLPSWIELYN